MKLSTKESNGDFEKAIIPEGTFLARLCSIIDLGTQYSEKYEKSNRKVELSFEIPECKHTFKEEDGEQPLRIAKQFTSSLGSKAALRKTLDSWGIDLSADMFSLDSLIGKLAMVSVKHNVVGDKTYANISAVTSVHKMLKDSAEPAFHEQVMFDLDEFEQGKYDALPQWKQEKIAESPEYIKVREASGEKVTAELPL
jgi:hypothetical protein